MANENLSAFDPDTFLETEFEGALDTVVIPVPIGEYQGQIENVKGRTFTDKEGTARAVMDVRWHVLTLDARIAAELGLEKPTVRQTIFLDLTEQGAVDWGKGKNTQLGKLKAAVGQNADGKKWKPKMLMSQIATLKIGHKPDGNDKTILYANVDKVSKAA